MCAHADPGADVTLTLDQRSVQLAIVAPDDATWDAFVRQHRQGHLLQSPGWGALKVRFGWQQRRLALLGPDGLLAGAQLLIRRRYGLAVAYVPRGPLLSNVPEVDRLLIRTLGRVARKARAVFLRIEPNLLEREVVAMRLHSNLQLQGFEVAEPYQPHSSVHLDLRPTPDQLFAAMSKGHRADVRRAEREGVLVRQSSGPSDLDTFYAIMQATAARAGFSLRSREYYAEVVRLFGDDACLLLALHNQQPVAVALLAAYAGAGLYLYSGSTDAGLRCGAQHAIQWRAICWARERGCRVYDFWGIPDALGRAASIDDPAERAQCEADARTDPLYGVYRFKKGFGGSVVRYLPAYDQVYLRPLYALLRRRVAG